VTKKIAAKLAVLLIIVLIIPLSGCAKSAGAEKQSASEIEKIKKAGKIVVGTSADYPPYEFHSVVNGKDEIVGFDIDIAKEIAKEIGVPLEIKDMKFDGLLAALETGNVDFVIAGMTPDAERAKQVDFSKIYYKAVQGLVVRANDKNSIKSLEDLKGKTVGVQKGSIQEKIANTQITGATVKGLGKVSDLMLELKNNKVDAIIVELPVASAYVSKNPDLAVSDVQIKSDEVGSSVAIKKNNKELVDSVNKTLDKLLSQNEVDKFFATASDLMDK
jgi:polar amino acid transport system substrate-binding protein